MSGRAEPLSAVDVVADLAPGATLVLDGVEWVVDPAPVSAAPAGDGDQRYEL